VMLIGRSTVVIGRGKNCRSRKFLPIAQMVFTGSAWTARRPASRTHRNGVLFYHRHFLGAWMFEAIPVLSSAECERVRQAVHALRSNWIVRGSADYPFYTVGAASYIDAVPQTPPPRYQEILVETNPVLREHFDWLYARLMNKLSVHLQAAVRTANELALPGFHVWQGLDVPTSPTSVHFDLQYTSIPWPDLGRSDLSRPLSFTLPIALPRGGGGLNSWEISYEEQVAHFQATRESTPAEEMPKLRTRTFHPYTPGVLALHSGHTLHQIAAVDQAYPDDERITLQGHGLYCDGAWTIYW
jgi:hypothetical protein